MQYSSRVCRVIVVSTARSLRCIELFVCLRVIQYTRTGKTCKVLES